MVDNATLGVEVDGLADPERFRVFYADALPRVYGYFYSRLGANRALADLRAGPYSRSTVVLEANANLANAILQQRFFAQPGRWLIVPLLLGIGLVFGRLLAGLPMLWGTVVTLLLMPHMEQIYQMQTLSMTDLMIVIQDLSVRLLLGVLAIMTVIAAVDFLYQRFEFLKSMRMTRQEIRDELKQTEGDPMVKGRLRQIRMERARRRMMANVPKADVVITNPTHFAVALSYKPAEMAAPRLVAKGADLIAARIREVAEEHDVPIVENPPVARGLFAAVDLDQEIPADHYRAVAEIISYVFRLKGREMPR